MRIRRRRLASELKRKCGSICACSTCSRPSARSPSIAIRRSCAWCSAPAARRLMRRNSCRPAMSTAVTASWCWNIVATNRLASEGDAAKRSPSTAPGPASRARRRRRPARRGRASATRRRPAAHTGPAKMTNTAVNWPTISKRKTLKNWRQIWSGRHRVGDPVVHVFHDDEDRDQRDSERDVAAERLDPGVVATEAWQFHAGCAAGTCSRAHFDRERQRKARRRIGNRISDESRIRDLETRPTV